MYSQNFVHPLTCLYGSHWLMIHSKERDAYALKQHIQLHFPFLSSLTHLNILIQSRFTYQLIHFKTSLIQIKHSYPLRLCMRCCNNQINYLLNGIRKIVFSPSQLPFTFTIHIRNYINCRSNTFSIVCYGKQTCSFHLHA